MDSAWCPRSETGGHFGGLGGRPGTRLRPLQDGGCHDALSRDPLTNRAALPGAPRIGRRIRRLICARGKNPLEFLAGLDDHMLKDIGLNRGDLRFALTEPFWRDVGAALIGRVGERGRRKDRPTSVPSIAPAALGWAARRIAPPVRVPRRAA